ncbi:hypothetical protein ACIQFU_24960 [Streptomyces sp. NPDC093065]|uniref:hypothetical protein n=1 Tax=Streptomyces sp. NPDC093065 TaxID=3366021 RepID=UPI0037F1A923
MAKLPRPRHITLGGHEAVALTVEEYEQLIASRRQIGGQSARVRVLAQQAQRTAELLTELEQLVGPPEGCREGATTEWEDCPPTCAAGDSGPSEQDSGCLRCTIAKLLRRHRDLSS